MDLVAISEKNNKRIVFRIASMTLMQIFASALFTGSKKSPIGNCVYKKTKYLNGYEIVSNGFKFYKIITKEFDMNEVKIKNIGNYKLPIFTETKTQYKVTYEDKMYDFSDFSSFCSLMDNTFGEVFYD